MLIALDIATVCVIKTIENESYYKQKKHQILQSLTNPGQSGKPGKASKMVREAVSQLLPWQQSRMKQTPICVQI